MRKSGEILLFSAPEPIFCPKRSGLRMPYPFMTCWLRFGKHTGFEDIFWDEQQEFLTFFLEIIQTNPDRRIFVLVSQIQFEIPSRKRLHNHGKSPFSMGKSTISMVIFNSKLLVVTRGYTMIYPNKSHEIP